jgi:hypothetical protein
MTASGHLAPETRELAQRFLERGGYEGWRGNMGLEGRGRQGRRTRGRRAGRGLERSRTGRRP